VHQTHNPVCASWMSFKLRPPVAAVAQRPAGAAGALLGGAASTSPAGNCVDLSCHLLRPLPVCQVRCSTFLCVQRAVLPGAGVCVCGVCVCGVCVCVCVCGVCVCVCVCVQRREDDAGVYELVFVVELVCVRICVCRDGSYGVFV